MKPNPRIIAAVSAIVVLLILIGWMAGFFTSKIDPALISSPFSEPGGSVAHVVQMEDVELNETLPATIAARDVTMVSSRILARVDKVSVRAGDTVTAGQILVQLEQAGLKSRVEQARDQVSAITAQHEDARLRLGRVSELRAKGLAAQADADTARAGYDSLTAQLSSAREALAEAEIVLEYSVIRAPISGRVVERLAEPGDTVPPGSPLLSLYDPLSIRAQANVREGLALKLGLGQSIQVDIDALGETERGAIEEIVPAADPASRSFLVKAALPHNAALMPGMFARFVIPVETRSLLAIPKSLVTPIGQLDMVRVITANGVERRYVRLGREFDEKVVVTAGLQAGERIIATD